MTEVPLRRAVAALMLLAAAVAAAEPVVLPFKDDQREVVFLAVDLASGEEWAVGPRRIDDWDRQLGSTIGIDDRQPPFSTFKIPNLLIALDTGAAVSSIIRSTGSQRGAPADWAEHQTSRSAFRRSTVWYFQELALEIGGAVYRDRLAAFEYGNRNAPDGSDTFWLDGALRISPREQSAFLAALLRGQLPVPASALDALREAALLDQRGGHRLYGKTGAGPARSGRFDGPFRGWLVGWIERPGRAPVDYALIVDGPDWNSIARFRRVAAERLLADAGAWPTSPALGSGRGRTPAGPAASGC